MPLEFWVGINYRISALFPILNYTVASFSVGRHGNKRTIKTKISKHQHKESITNTMRYNASQKNLC